MKKNSLTLQMVMTLMIGLIVCGSSFGQTPQRSSTLALSEITSFDKHYGFKQPGIGGALDATFNIGKRVALVEHAELLNEPKAFAEKGRVYIVSTGARYFVTQPLFVYGGFHFSGWNGDGASKNVARFDYGGGYSTPSGDFTATAAGFLPLNDPNSVRGLKLSAEYFATPFKAKWYGVRLAGVASFGTANRQPVNPERVSVRGSAISVGFFVNLSAISGS